MTCPLDPAAMAATHAAAFQNSRPWSETEFSELTSSKFCFAAGDKRCFALVRVIADEAELLTIATHPDYRRQGLARAVMAQWQSRAHQKSASTAFLEVAADNHAAIRMYLSCGFQQSGVRRGYYARKNASAVDARLFLRQLP
jgi:ribosomal-protein-alanine N-acetyltransferase